jgi:hypothetical protein
MTIDPPAAPTAPANPIGPAPLRRPGSVRRTSTIDTVWPEGMGYPMRMRGHARDLFTPVDGSPPRVIAEDRMEILASPKREIIEIATSPVRTAAQELVGSRGGGHLRALLATVLPEEKNNGTPLYLILDDFSGASLVAGWAWSRWTVDWASKPRTSSAGRNGQMEGICSGFRPGSSALKMDGTSNSSVQSSAIVGSLINPLDPIGWHELIEQAGVAMRRARRIDAWVDDVVHIDVGFQDSGATPEGGRAAVHEYHVTATADPRSFELISVNAEPRILPFRECPAASSNVSRMIGAPITDFRLEVLSRLPGTLGCTHLNDVLRSLAEVPHMLAAAGILKRT